MAERSFAPTVLTGLVASVLAAVAGSRDWVRVDAGAADEPVVEIFWESSPGLGQMPLAGALGLVLLACWGVVLVSRGSWRRAVAGVGIGAALGLLAVWVVGLLGLRDEVRTELVRAGLDGPAVEWTVWFWLAGAAALLAVGTCAVAVVRAPRWPAMGARYDAPTGGRPMTVVPLAEQDPTDVWKALDEGRDPTSDPAP